MSPKWIVSGFFLSLWLERMKIPDGGQAIGWPEISF
jgi:hypothetical protein